MANRRIWTPPQVGLGEARTKRVLGGTFAILSADVGTINNTVELFVAPAGFVVTNIAAYSTDMDTGGPTLTLSLGDSGSAARFLSASTIGQAGTSVLVLASTGQNYQFLVDTVIVLLVAAAATTPAAGTLTVNFEGYIA